MTTKKSSKSTAHHYVDDEKFYEAMVKYKEDVIRAEEAGDDKPRVPEFVGECIWKISNHLATSPKFSNYPFKEDMIMYACENAVRYAHNFDHIKYKKPFAYFTRIILFAFYRKIADEKKQLYIKYKSIESAMVDDSLFDADPGGDDVSVLLPQRNENREAFIRDYEDKLNKNTTQRKKKTGIEKFSNDEED